MSEMHTEQHYSHVQIYNETRTWRNLPKTNFGWFFWIFFMLNLILSKMSHGPNKCIDCNAELLGGISGAAADILQWLICVIVTAVFSQ